LRQARAFNFAIATGGIDKFGAACRARPELGNVVQAFFDAIAATRNAEASNDRSLSALWNSMALTRLNMNKFGAT